MGHAVVQMVEVICYKPEGSEFESRWGNCIFFTLYNPSNHTMALGLIQPLNEMNTRKYLCGKARSARKADNLNAIYEPII
jgi:hypothetical protein